MVYLNVNNGLYYTDEEFATLANGLLDDGSYGTNYVNGEFRGYIAARLDGAETYDEETGYWVPMTAYFLPNGQETTLGLDAGYLGTGFWNDVFYTGGIPNPNYTGFWQSWRGMPAHLVKTPWGTYFLNGQATDLNHDGTGTFQGAHYINGQLSQLDLNGDGVIEGKIYRNGYLFTGFLNGALYAAGLQNPTYTGRIMAGDGGAAVNWWGAYYINGQPTTLEWWGNGLFNGVNYANGIANFTGVYNGQNYIQGSASFTGTFEGTNYIQSQNAATFTGVHNELRYENGALFTGDFEGTNYIQGQNAATFTGTYEGTSYVNGIADFTGVYNELRYENGVLFTGIFDGDNYINGISNFTGVFNGQNYVNGAASFTGVSNGLR